MMNGVSVIVCCYNSALRIESTLLHLQMQYTKPNLPWEVILIDNNSSDNTVEIAKTTWDKKLNYIPLRVISESTPGLIHARKKGIINAKYNYLLFCDDDNWLNIDFLTMGFEILNNDKKIAVLGSKSIAEYETTPPTWFIDNAKDFAIGEQNTSSGDITHSRGWVWGAGSFYRKDLLNKLFEANSTFILTGRLGDKLFSGDDVEQCLFLKLLGYKIYYSEKLVLKHFIPVSRFNEKKYFNLIKNNYRNIYYFDILNSRHINWIALHAKLFRSIIFLFYFKLKRYVCGGFSVEKNISAFTGYFFGYFFILRFRNEIRKSIKF